jgi:hypothetical protein
MFMPIATLVKRCTFVRTHRSPKAFTVQTLDVPDPFSSPTALMKPDESASSSPFTRTTSFAAPRRTPGVGVRELSDRHRYVSEASRTRHSPAGEGYRGLKRGGLGADASTNGAPASSDVPFEQPVASGFRRGWHPAPDVMVLAIARVLRGDRPTNDGQRNDAPSFSPTGSVVDVPKNVETGPSSVAW